MRKIIPLFIGTMLLSSAAVMAQTTAPSTTPPARAPSVDTPAAPTPSVVGPSTSMTMTPAEAAAWVDKKVYSSDGKNVGEVAQIARDSSGKITELHADVGGFLGLGETRVRLTPAQFKIGADRIDLLVTAEQVKALPKIAK